ncbi:non-ribosomal peptide synthetase [Microbispora corallina]|uniref:Non-ribosomal peptide synthetase n=1 Tax=Microbispora corallina TaxID=83302 RepID=A0ABQ4G3M4_9ACTN|nr:non-ribosomal peptide synthetase [Microbispora corallina]GIH41668.1 non-ribosomal peptide synthetase [Microbispora corallina]
MGQYDARPLSAAQERMWFLDRLRPGDPSSHVFNTSRLTGPLDAAAFDRAVRDVVDRHEPLRARFPGQAGHGGRPVQVVEPPGRFRVEHLTAAAEDVPRLIEERTNRPFDLAEGPLLRAALIRLGPREHVLCLVFHHIVCDGWSLKVFLDEVGALYTAHTEGKPSPLPPLAARFLDIAAERAEPDPASLDYWRANLSGAPVLELPADRPRPAVRTTAGDDHTLPLPPDLMAELRSFAGRERCTLFMVFLAAYQAVLARYSGQDDLCVGAATAGRDQVEHERLIGLFAGTLVLRGDLSGDPSFREMLRRARSATLRAYQHRHVPFERILTEVEVDRDLSRTPLFQTLFVLNEMGEPLIPLPEVEVELVDAEYRQVQTDLMLGVFGEGDERRLVLTYNTDLFEAETVAGYGRALLRVLEAAVADPLTPLSRLLPVDGAERDLLVRERNDTALPLPAAATLLDLVDGWALRAPQAVAVQEGTAPGRFTYAELGEASARIARRLAAEGAGPGSVVAVLAERSPATVAGLLGVMCSGAAYLPLDPGYPRARLSLLLADSGARHLLVDPAVPPAVLAEVLGEVPHDVRVISLDRPGDHPAVPLAAPGPDDPAYVLYTSGSTGRPKGVVVPHRALLNFLTAMESLLGAGPDDVWLSLTSLSFDISGLELYLPLTTGGRIVVADREAARDGDALARLIARSGVTHVQATPSGWRVLLDAAAADHAPGTGAAPRSVTALVGGEALPPALARDLRARVARLLNMYGPTETTIWSTAWEVPAEPRGVSIGRPIGNTQVYVVDESLELVPLGVPGELVIGGLGVATGYLGRPALTAERFVPDPYGAPGGRLYRTGDVVRARPDGTLDYLGRADNQVKLRGHRIEPGEIEAALEAQPSVRQAVVAVHDERLVAYVVGEADRDDLAARLPASMVPAVFVPMDALPLTPNGKVDRRALPAPERRLTREGRPPATAAERRVAEVFAEVLGLGAVSEVSAEDDFFALGGHSLLATRVVARLGGRVPVRELFAHPDVAGLARVLEAHLGSGDGPGGAAPVAVPRRPEGTAPPLSAAQERLWFLHRLDPRDASYNMFMVRRLRGPLDRDALARALAALTDRHEVLRTRYPDDQGRPLAVVEPASASCDVEWLEAGSEAEAERLVAERVNAPFDLAAALPLRAAVVRLGPGDHVLCVVLHHIAGDGWSLNVLFDDLAALYAGEPGLAPLPVQYGDVALWQRSAPADEALAYWRERLAGVPPLELPADAGAGAAEGGAFHGLRLPADLADRLEAVGREEGATLFMVLLAAYQVLLAAHSGQTDFAVGSPTAGREIPETDPLIGYLTSTLVLRAELDGDPTVRDLLRRTRESVLDAFAHQEIPFEALLAELDVERDTGRTPLFQTMFVLHSQDAGPRPSFAGLDADFFPAGFAQAKFGLMLEAWRDPDGISLTFGYDTAVLAPATVESMAARFALLLESLRPDVPISALPALTEADEALLRAWSRGPALPERQTVPAMVARTVARAPGAVAVECGDQRVTYAELDRRARALAARLTGHRVVGVCLGPIPDRVAAMLAAWHAGAAYLPLDPAYPAERLARLLADGGATVVVAGPDAPLPATIPVVDPAADPGPGEPPAPQEPRPRDAAYVMHTSGSTGEPKGVVVEHGGLGARVAWMREAYGLGPGDRIVQFASPSFDTHAEEIFPALAAGATVVLLPGGAVTLPDLLAADAGVTVLDLPTAYWQRLADLAGEIVWPEALRLVVIGGEQAAAEPLARWRARFGGRVRVVNTYGPTETTVIATADDLDDLDGGGRPPIGRPIAATSVHVLDRYGRPAPPGAPGDLHIGGAGVARGYAGRPGLTADRFVPDPYGEPGGRLYRTGDRVRWRADGRLEFLGRLDDQVKVRGHRIEPGEVEARLLAHPGVTEAAVAAAGEILAGYVAGSATAEELRAHLAVALPPYMVPDVFVRLDALPRTAGGKVDRRALPKPEPEREREYVAPRSDAEALVADVWAEVLGVGRIGAFDDFFHLGGHSLLAVRVAARLRALAEVDIPIRTLFARRTVADLGAAVEDLLVAELEGISDEDARLLLERMEER